MLRHDAAAPRRRFATLCFDAYAFLLRRCHAIAAFMPPPLFMLRGDFAAVFFAISRFFAVQIFS